MTNDNKPDRANRKHLTIADVCAELNIARSTFYDWRAKKHPHAASSSRMATSEIQCVDLERWLTTLEDAA